MTENLSWIQIAETFVPRIVYGSQNPKSVACVAVAQIISIQMRTVKKTARSASQVMNVMSYVQETVIPASMLQITICTYPGNDAVMELTMNLYSVKGIDPLADASVLIKTEREYLVSNCGLRQKT